MADHDENDLRWQQNWIQRWRLLWKLKIVILNQMYVKKVGKKMSNNHQNNCGIIQMSPFPNQVHYKSRLNPKFYLSIWRFFWKLNKYIITCLVIKKPSRNFLKNLVLIIVIFGSMVVKLINTATFLSLVWPYSIVTGQGLTKGDFFSKRAIHFLHLQISNKKIFQKAILSLKFEFVVYYYWWEI